MVTTETRRRDETRLPAIGIDPSATEGQVVLFEQWALVRRTWKWVLGTALVVAVVATGYTVLFVPTEYMSTVTVVPPNKSQSPLDNLVGGLASSIKDFGLSRLVGGKSGESGYSRVAILFSRSVVDSLIGKFDLWDAYGIPRNRPDLLQDAVRANILIEVDQEGPLSISVYDRDPKRAQAMASSLVAFADSVSRDLNRRETEPISRTIGKRFRQVVDEQERLAVQLTTFMKSNKLFDVEKQPSIVGTALFEAEAQVREQRIMAQTLEQILGPNDARVIQSKAIVRELESEVRRLAAGHGTAIEGLDLSKAPAAAVEGARLQAAYEINNRVLALLQPMYEQSVLDQQREIPTFQVLDQAQVPLNKARPRYSLVAAGAFIGAIVICYIMIAVISFARSFNARYHGFIASVPPTDRIRGN